MKTLIALTILSVVCATVVLGQSEERSIQQRPRREAKAEAYPNRPTYVPPPRPPHPRLRREAEAEADPNRLTYVPPPRPPHPRL